MFLKLTLLSLSLLFLLHLSLQFQTSPEQVAKLAQQSVVKVNARRPLPPENNFLGILLRGIGYKYLPVSGSGVLIGRDGKVVTAHHVIESAYFITATSYKGRRAGCTVLADDPERDLALLNCDGFIGMDGVQHLAPLRIAVGSRVIPAGYASGGPLVVTDGIVANSLDDKGKLLVSAPAGPGMSGGAVFNYRGELIGVVQAGYIQPPFTGIITSSLQLHRFLRNLYTHANKE